MPIAFSALLDEVIGQVIGAAAERGLKIDRESVDAVLFVMGDLPLLRIILSNLLDNAVCYTADRGGVSIRSAAAEGWAEIVFSNPVADFPVNLNRLFEPLFRQEASRHDAGAHLGIGLTLSRDAARSMGGTLHARRGSDDGVIEFVLRMRAC